MGVICAGWIQLIKRFRLYSVKKHNAHYNNDLQFEQNLLTKTNQIFLYSFVHKNKEFYQWCYIFSKQKRSKFLIIRKLNNIINTNLTNLILHRFLLIPILFPTSKWEKLYFTNLIHLSLVYIISFLWWILSSYSNFKYPFWINK